MSKLTINEISLLKEIISMYDENNNLCFTRQLSSSEKGTMSSLVKKQLVYDSFESECGNGYDSHNYFPYEMNIQLPDGDVLSFEY